MKKKILVALSTFMVVPLSVGLLTGCGSDEASIVGSWDNDGEMMSIVFEEDGTAMASDDADYYPFTYEWDGTTLTLDDDTDITVTGTLNEDGELELEDIGGTFVQVDEVTYIPVEDEDEEEEVVEEEEEVSEDFDIVSNTWEVGDVLYNFYSDGTAQIIYDDDDISDATYEWDGQNGTIYLGEESTELTIINGEFCILGEDGEYYTFMEY